MASLPGRAGVSSCWWSMPTIRRRGPRLQPDLVTPNAAEAARMLGLPQPGSGGRQDWAASHREELLRAAGAAAVVVTLDREGTVSAFPRPGSPHMGPARRGEAGLGRRRYVCRGPDGGARRRALAEHQRGSRPGGSRRGRPQTGYGGVRKRELSRYLGSFENSALGAQELTRQLEAHRAEGHRIVLTNGCFDVLHRGHTRYLNQAKQLGDVLVVALNSDASVRRLKGDGRPINTATDRAAVIAALSCVDYVTVFEESTAVPLIEQLRPEVYAKGGDYSPEMLVETARWKATAAG